MLKHGSLFSGIGGFDLAAQQIGWTNVFQVEKEPYLKKLLKQNFPNTEQYGDIYEFDGTQYRGIVDLISGGFPCQPFSVAGKQGGKTDDRYLWPEMLRIIRDVGPSYVVGENVTGIIGLALDTVLSDLEAQGYTTETFIIPACGKNAWHRRDRVWIIAYKNTDSFRCFSIEREGQSSIRGFGEFSTGSNERVYSESVSTDTDSRIRRKGGLHEGYRSEAVQYDTITPHSWPDWSEWQDNIPEPGICRMANGIPNRVDRIKALGNAIVPQIAYELFKVINQIPCSHTKT